MINEQEQIWNFANFVEKMEGVWVGKWVENDVVIEANCVKKLWPPHSPTHLLRGGKKKTCNNFNCSIKLNPNFGWGHALFVYNFLDYLSWINLVKLICWSISVTLKPFETLDFTSPRAPTWTLWGPVTESWPLIFSWKLFHRSLVGGPKKHPSSFSIKTFFFSLKFSGG